MLNSHEQGFSLHIWSILSLRFVVNAMSSYVDVLQQILGANPANLFRSAIGPATQISMGAPSRTIIVLTSSKVMWTCRVCAHGAA